MSSRFLAKTLLLATGTYFVEIQARILSPSPTFERDCEDNYSGKYNNGVGWSRFPCGVISGPNRDSGGEDDEERTQGYTYTAITGLGIGTILLGIGLLILAIYFCAYCCCKSRRARRKRKEMEQQRLLQHEEIIGNDQDTLIGNHPQHYHQNYNTIPPNPQYPEGRGNGKQYFSSISNPGNEPEFVSYQNPPPAYSEIDPNANTRELLEPNAPDVTYLNDD